MAAANQIRKLIKDRVAVDYVSRRRFRRPFKSDHFVQALGVSA